MRVIELIQQVPQIPSGPSCLICLTAMISWNLFSVRKASIEQPATRLRCRIEVIQPGLLYPRELEVSKGRTR